MWTALLIWDFGLSSYNFRRVTQVVYLSAAFGVFIFCCHPLKGSVHLPVLAKILIILGLLFGTLSALMSQYPEKGLQEVGLYSLLIMSSLLLAKSIDERKLISVISLIGIAIGFYAFGYLFQYAIHLQYPPDAWMHTVYGFTNPRILNHAQNCLIPLLALLPMVSKDKLPLIQILSWIPLIVMYFFLFLSESRGITLSLLVSGIAGYFCFKEPMKQLIRIHGRALIVGLFLYVVLIWLIPYVLEHGFNGFRPLTDTLKTYDRLELWSTAWALTVQNPLFGVGPQQFILSTGKGPGSPHNMVFQWLSEWGVVATLCLITALLWGGISFLIGLRKRLDKKQLTQQATYVQISALWACCSAVLHAQISGVLITPMSQLMMVLVVGYCLHAHNKESVETGARVSDYSVVARTVSGLWVSLLILLSMSFFIIFYGEFIQGGYPISIPFEPMAPRFWQNGAFQLNWSL